MSGKLSGITLSTLAHAVGGQLIGADGDIEAVSTDSRHIESGEVYFCLSGENFDGHDYAAAAVSAGATAVVCERELNSGVAEVIVPDSRRAYGELAKLWRAGLPVKLIGVTGSNGKTTVKQLLQQICAAAGSVHATRANDNNEIGVPKTVLGINASHQYAVVEMGANQLGEIEWLGSITRPDVSIITNVSASHLEGFGDINSVYREKSAIYTNLASNGVAIVNRDDHFAEDWLQLNRGRSVITFGAGDNADVYAKSVASGRVRLHSQLQGREKTVETNCQLVGAHNLMNIAAAAAAAMASGIDIDTVAKGVANAEPVKGRLNFHQLQNNIAVIDDTYNANPASARAAIDVLADTAGEHWLVLGDLKELGDEAVDHHSSLGQYALQNGVNRVFATGELSRHCVESFGDKGQWFSEKEQLIAALRAELDRLPEGSAASILVKGSRSMAMDEVVAALQSSRVVADVVDNNDVVGEMS
jgi:UDP-N-acetylmuramoyl-tripeptide--D-alanyl-D-alanine ligase